ncbi:MAG: LysR family transcriptional regulator [Gammaproteobacteria bacterium]|nr:LysR family transcriptional regulator [Gammaproteobacteria bacterium]
MPIHSAFLSCFREVCRCGSIRAAARNLHIASSAVNRRILKVEKELGVELFVRHAGGMRLTEEGELLRRHVERTLEDAGKTLDAIRALGAADHPVITIAGQESVIARFLPPVLVALHAEYPEVSTAFKAASGDALAELLLSGRVDIALAFDPAPQPGIELVGTCELPVGAVMSPGHPLEDRGRISLAECAPYPLILPDESWPLRRLLDGEIESLDVSLNILTSSNSEEFLRTMFDLHLGIGFQTVMGIEPQLERGELVFVPLGGKTPMRQTFAVCVGKKRSGGAMHRLTESLVRRLDSYGGG